MSNELTRRIPALLVLAVVLIAADIASGKCGTERWSVKTGTDADAWEVNTSLVEPTTISQMVKWPAPHPLPSNKRIAHYETTVWVVTATLTGYVLEDDSDYHLVLTDDSGRTIIAEIPSVSCVASGSPFRAMIDSARKEFDSKFHATGTFKDANVKVQVTGVGFFDFQHHQTGVAPNAVELHPVLAIKFNPGAAPPPGPSPVTPGPAPAALLQDGGFESTDADPAVWHASKDVIDDSESAPAHSGSRKAWLCGYGATHTDKLWQRVTIPVGAGSPMLSFWLMIETSEKHSAGERDTLQVQVRDSAGKLLATLGEYSNVDSQSGYVQKKLDLSAFKGKTIRLMFVGDEDAAHPTSFLIDDVTIEDN